MESRLEIIFAKHCLQNVTAMIPNPPATCHLHNVIGKPFDLFAFRRARANNWRHTTPRSRQQQQRTASWMNLAWPESAAHKPSPPPCEMESEESRTDWLSGKNKNIIQLPPSPQPRGCCNGFFLAELSAAHLDGINSHGMSALEGEILFFLRHWCKTVWGIQCHARLAARNVTGYNHDVERTQCQGVSMRREGTQKKRESNRTGWAHIETALSPYWLQKRLS